MKEHIESHWFARFPEDLAWDIFTLDCILVVTLAMGIAGVAAISERFAQFVMESQGWLWSTALTLAVVAIVCFLRVVMDDLFTHRLPRRR
ncbi:MAG: hypothetical protein J7605_04315 [Variovorax sp.]|nr:hypothetical protein [Variovorax sp.]